MENLEIYNKTKNCKLPKSNNPNKDTRNFMCLMLSKINFVKLAMEYNVNYTKYFSWIDIGIFHMFKNKEMCSKIINKIGSLEYTGEFIYVPGCWEKNSVYNFYDFPNWRFCGSFFLGSNKKIEEFYQLSKDNLDTFIENNILTWEINYWAWLETHKNWTPDWYRADHNNTILTIPTSHIAHH